MPELYSTYRQRLHAFRPWRTYELRGDALGWRDDGGATGQVPFSRIREIRISYRPTRVQSNLYRTRLILRGGGRIDITNTSYQSFASFSEDSPSYSGFVRELHRRLAASGTPITYRKGSTRVGYAANAAILALSAAGLGFVLWLTDGELTELSLVRLGLILGMVPVAYLFMRKSRPEYYDPLSLPADGLPPPATP